MPFSPLHLLLLILLIGMLLAFIQVGLLAIAFDKLGLSPNSGLLLLFSALLGSMINLPVARVSAEAPPDAPPPPWPGLLRGPVLRFEGHTLIAVNVGGCIIPVMFSLYLLRHNPLPAFEVAAAVAVVTLISYAFSRPIARLGIAMPVLIAPLTAAVTALLINAEHSAPLAYISGTLGVLIGADLLRMKDVRRLGAPVASIGGAGTFDGIFMTGIVAALLA
jgi:uncharacterized membrane protein